VPDELERPDDTRKGTNVVGKVTKNKAAIRWLEIGFDLSYLVVIWGLVWAMWRRRSSVAPAHLPVADRLHEAFGLLAVGDTAHVGLRVAAYARGEDRAFVTWLGQRLSLLGLGELLTAITVTFFYVLALDAWRLRFGKKFGRLGDLLLGAAGGRLALLTLPLNQWQEAEPAQPWSIYRNVPLLAQGLGLAYLILRDARAAGDRTFRWMGQMILISYAFYTPVILFARRVPQLGLLMIPKTLAYVAMALGIYRDLYRNPRS
jgi:hypothetical protein